MTISSPLKGQKANEEITAQNEQTESNEKRSKEDATVTQSELHSDSTEMPIFLPPSPAPNNSESMESEDTQEHGQHITKGQSAISGNDEDLTSRISEDPSPPMERKRNRNWRTIQLNPEQKHSRCPLTHLMEDGQRKETLKGLKMGQDLQSPRTCQLDFMETTSHPRTQQTQHLWTYRNPHRKKKGKR